MPSCKKEPSLNPLTLSKFTGFTSNRRARQYGNSPRWTVYVLGTSRFVVGMADKVSVGAATTSSSVAGIIVGVPSITGSSEEGSGVSIIALGPSMATAVCVAKLSNWLMISSGVSWTGRFSSWVVGVVSVVLEADFTHPDDPMITAKPIKIIRTRLFCMLDSLINNPL